LQNENVDESGSIIALQKSKGRSKYAGLFIVVPEKDGSSSHIKCALCDELGLKPSVFVIKDSSTTSFRRHLILYVFFLIYLFELYRVQYKLDGVPLQFYRVLSSLY
jgi:hypothetical protein